MDVEWIGQVLRNLVSNALTHTPRSGKISISVYVQASDVVVQVTNTGAALLQSIYPMSSSASIGPIIHARVPPEDVA